MTIYLLSALAFVVAWSVAWFAVIRPQLKRYASTTALLARIDAAEGDVWAKTKLWLENKKTMIVAFVMSGFTMAKSAADQATAAAAHAATAAAGVTPDQLVPLQDKSLWSSFFSDIRTMQIVAAVNILIVVLHMHGANKAAALEPKA